MSLLPAGVTLENVTDVAAVCAVASPLWVHQLSDGAQFILPFLGGIWLAVQIIDKLNTMFRKKP